MVAKVETYYFVVLDSTLNPGFIYSSIDLLDDFREVVLTFSAVLA